MITTMIFEVNNGKTEDKQLVPRWEWWSFSNCELLGLGRIQLITIWSGLNTVSMVSIAGIGFNDEKSLFFRSHPISSWEFLIIKIFLGEYDILFVIITGFQVVFLFKGLIWQRIFTLTIQYSWEYHIIEWFGIQQKGEKTHTLWVYMDFI